MPTKPAFVHSGDWSSESDSHPAMKWMHEYTNAFDTGDFKRVIDDYHTKDEFTFVRSDGRVYHDTGDKLVALMQEVYGGFTAYTHIPYYLSCVENDDGWEMIGQAHVYANLPGQPAQGEPPKVKDEHGKEWDVKVSSLLPHLNWSVVQFL